jgi:hypothetical protein
MEALVDTGTELVTALLIPDRQVISLRKGQDFGRVELLYQNSRTTPSAL